MNRRQDPRARLPRLVALAAAPLLIVIGAAVVSGGEDSGLPTTVEVSMRYSHFEPAVVRVPVGVPVTFVLRNDDPIDHEWIVASDEVHAAHRTSTELVHGDRPTEIPVDAGAVRTTVVTFEEPGSLAYICHLPGHEAYGMVGRVEVVSPGS